MPDEFSYAIEPRNRGFEVTITQPDNLQRMVFDVSVRTKDAPLGIVAKVEMAYKQERPTTRHRNWKTIGVYGGHQNPKLAKVPPMPRVVCVALDMRIHLLIDVQIEIFD